MGFALERFCNGLQEMSIREVSQKPLLQFALSCLRAHSSGSFVSHSSLHWEVGSGKQAYPIRFCANDPYALQIALFMQQLLYSNQACQIRTSWSKWDCRIYWIVNYKFLRIFKFKVKNKLIMILYIE